MKRNILSLLIALFATMQVAAQTYDNLWKQAEINAQKDQPKSEIAVMKKIIAKASAAKDYGQLLAAEIRQMTLWKEISADSLTPNVKRMEAEVLKVNDPALKAVRYAVLGKVYRDMNEKKSQEFFKKALGQPELLARHTSAEYVPLTLKGVDGSSFNNVCCISSDSRQTARRRICSCTPIIIRWAIGVRLVSVPISSSRNTARTT